MKILKSRWAFIVLLILLIIIFATGLYLLKSYFPTDVKDFSSDIIAIVALITAVGIPIYEKLYPKQPLREYKVIPMSLDGYFDSDIRIKVRLINSGEVDINIQFQWIDFRNERFTLRSTKDSRKAEIDSSITLPAGTQKDIYLIFDYERNNSGAKELFNEAFDKREPRLVESFRHIPARLTWSDVTSTNMQEVGIPLGSWIITYLNKKILDS